jgi:hypothetical protein
MIELPSERVSTYLEQAARIAAVWIALPPWGVPIHVGSTNNLYRTRNLFRQLEAGGDLAFAWVTWVASGEVAEWLSWAPRRLFVTPNKRLVVSAPLEDVIAEIEKVAEASNTRLTAHDVVLLRTTEAMAKIDRAFDKLRDAGVLHQFNTSYKLAREAGRDLPLYRQVNEELRRIVVSAMMRRGAVDTGEIVDQMRRRFPWLRTVNNNGQPAR